MVSFARTRISAICAYSRLDSPAATTGFGGLASSPTGWKIPWTAPGTPYSYGPPTTVGTRSKLKMGGGEETCHSSVRARHGFAAARGPPRHDATMLYAKTRKDSPRQKLEIEMKRFHPANASE